MFDIHLGQDAIVGQNRRGGALSDESATCLDELHQFCQSFDPHASANVIARVFDTEIRRQLCLLVRDRVWSRLWNSIDLRNGAAADAWEDDHVIFGAKISLAKLLVGEVSVGNSIVVECCTHPA